MVERGRVVVEWGRVVVEWRWSGQTGGRAG